MGLDITCTCGSISFRAGSYSGFHWFRKRIAKHLGFDLEVYWANRGQPHTPLQPLLGHSDCDGYLTPQQCKQMIEPMEQLIQDVIRKLQNPWTLILGECDDEDKYFIELCKDWLEAFRHCAKTKCRLIFC